MFTPKTRQRLSDTFPNGRRFAHRPIRGKKPQDWDNGKRCKKIEGSVYLLASPPDDDLFGMLRGVINPIAQLRAERPTAQVHVLNSAHARLEGLLRGIPNVEVIPHRECRCFAEAIAYFRAVDNTTHVRNLYGWEKPGDSVVFLVDRGVTIRNADAVAESMCHGCVADVVEVGSDDIPAKVGMARALVVRSVKDLGYGVFLDENAMLVIMIDKDIERSDWLAPLAEMLRRNISGMRITRENNVIEIQ
jgi:hypothetical protein